MNLSMSECLPGQPSQLNQFPKDITEFSQVKSILDIPEESMLHIFAYLSSRDLLLIQRVCKLFNALAKNNCLWYPFVDTCAEMTKEKKWVDVFKVGSSFRASLIPRLIDGSVHISFSDDLEGSFSKFLQNLNRKHIRGGATQVKTGDMFNSLQWKSKLLILKLGKIEVTDLTSNVSHTIMPQRAALYNFLEIREDKLILGAVQGAVLEVFNMHNEESIWCDIGGSHEVITKVRVSNTFMVLAKCQEGCAGSQRIEVFNLENGKSIRFDGSYQSSFNFTGVQTFDVEDNFLYMICGEIPNNRSAHGKMEVAMFDLSSEMSVGEQGGKWDKKKILINPKLKIELLKKKDSNIDIVVKEGKFFYIQNFKDSAIAQVYDCKTGDYLFTIDGEKSINSLTVQDNVIIAVDGIHINTWNLGTGRLIIRRKDSRWGKIDYMRIIAGRILCRTQGEGKLFNNFLVDFVPISTNESDRIPYTSLENTSSPTSWRSVVWFSAACLGVATLLIGFLIWKRK